MKNSLTNPTRQGLSLLELLTVVTVLGILTAVIVPRFATETNEAEISACEVHRGNIEIQVELWNTNMGSYPQADLSDIGNDPNYFPEGLPVCPFDNTGYTIDPLTGRVIGHNHR